MELDSLYQAVILDHYRSPLHKGLSSQKDIQVHHNNPSCGDEVKPNYAQWNG
jgi:nitrogen fixation NifU-like protein